MFVLCTDYWFYLLCLIKLYKRGEKDMVKNIVNAIVEQMEKENFKKLVLVLTLTLVMALGMSISV